MILRNNLSVISKGGSQERRRNNHAKERSVANLSESRTTRVRTDNHERVNWALAGWVSFHTNSQRYSCPSFHLKDFILRRLWGPWPCFQLIFLPGLQTLWSTAQSNSTFILGRSGLLAPLLSTNQEQWKDFSSFPFFFSSSHPSPQSPALIWNSPIRSSPWSLIKWVLC